MGAYSVVGTNNDMHRLYNKSHFTLYIQLVDLCIITYIDKYIDTYTYIHIYKDTHKHIYII